MPPAGIFGARRRVGASKPVAFRNLVDDLTVCKALVGVTGTGFEAAALIIGQPTGVVGADGGVYPEIAQIAGGPPACFEKP